MTVTLYSFLMAVLWFSVFVLLGTLVQRRTGVILCCLPVSLLCLTALTVVRLVLPLDLPVTQVIRSSVVYPAVQDFLYDPLRGPGTAPCFVVLLCVWGLGSLLTGIRLVWHTRRDRRAIAALPTAPAPAAQQCLKALLQRRRKPQNVALLVSPALTTPLITGLFRPVILLTPEAAALPRRELKYVLTHELTHLANGDLWVKLLVRLLCCFMWWNPCVYLLQKDLDSVLEYNCDLAVTQDLPEEEQQDYLEAMLSVLRQLKQRQGESAPGQALSACFVGIPEKEILHRRFHLVLDQQKRPRRVSQVAFAVVALGLFVCSYAVVLQPAYGSPVSANGVEITRETSYILAGTDGTYSLVYNGAIMGAVTREDFEDVPFSQLEIVREGGK